jgi:hypothetical protein
MARRCYNAQQQLVRPQAGEMTLDHLGLAVVSHCSLQFQKYAFEYIPGQEDGAIAWFVGDEETFRMSGKYPRLALHESC